MADLQAWTVVRLTKRRDRSNFSCGDAAFDTYLRKYAGQNERLNVGRHYVAVRADSATVLGYYSLSAGAVEWDILPDEARKKLPKYPVPVAHLGRLAVDHSMQRQGLGEFLLVDGLVRIARLTDEIGIQAVEVVAASDAARAFYSKYGFISLQDDARHLYLAIATIRKLGFGKT